MPATTESSLVRDRQDPLRRLYRQTPEEARITDRARTTGGLDGDAFHGRVLIGPDEHAAVLDYGIHSAVGGDHDLPNPGDLLCAALAACLDSSLRMIAEHLGVTLTRLEVAVEAEVDVRGTLLVDRDVPVGFQEMRCNVSLAVAEGTPEPLVSKLLAAAEHSCVNAQTLMSPVPLRLELAGS